MVKVRNYFSFYKPIYYKNLVDAIHKTSVEEGMNSNGTSNQQQQDMINGLVSLQNTLMHHFLSMPSLLKSGAGGCAGGITPTTNSILMENSGVGAYGLGGGTHNLLGTGDSNASSSSSGLKFYLDLTLIF